MLAGVPNVAARGYSRETACADGVCHASLSLSLPTRQLACADSSQEWRESMRQLDLSHQCVLHTDERVRSLRRGGAAGARNVRP